MALNLDERELLTRYGEAKQTEIERLLRQYGTSLSDIRELYPQLTTAIEQRRLMTTFPSQPVFFTPSEAANMGLSLEEGWMLKMTASEGGYSSSLITPQKWEITENDLYISPTGEKYSKADLEALLAPPSGLEAEITGIPTLENLTEEGKAVYQEYQASGGTLGVAGWIDLRERQQLETEQIFGAVFPDQDIQEVIDYINRDPQTFLADLREIGWTVETEALLRNVMPDITQEDLQEIFAAPAQFTPENFFKDYVWDAFILPVVTMLGHGLATAFTTIFPSVFESLAPELAKVITIPIQAPIGGLSYIASDILGEADKEALQVVPKTAEGVTQWLTDTFLPNLQERAEQKFVQLVNENDEWVAEHPELTPNPAYLQNPWEHTELFRDPGYIVYSIFSTLGYSLSVMGTMVAVSAVATPVVGIPAGMMVAAGPEATSMTEELVKQGVPFEEAAQWGSLYGLVAGGIETVSDLPFIGLVFKPIGAAVKPMWNTILKGTANRLVKGILTGVVVTQTEALEEVLTQVIHNAILKHYDESQSLLQGVSQAYIQATIASMPFAGIGGYASFRTFRSSLSKETGEKFDNLVTNLQDKGLTEEQAQVQATNELARDTVIEAELSKAIEAAQLEYYEEHPEVSRPTLEPTIPSLPESILQDMRVAEKVKPVTRATLTPTQYEEGVYSISVEGREGGVGAVVAVIQGDALFVNRISMHEKGVLTRSLLRSIDEQLITMAQAKNLKSIRIAAKPETFATYSRAGYVREGDTNIMVKAVPTAEVPTTPTGMPEAGLQPSMLEEVPAKEIRPEAAGKLVQARMDDYLRLREYNKKAVTDRIAEIKKALEKKGRTELGLRGTLALELARLEALQELEAIENVIELDQLIQQVWTELGNRSLPFHGRAKNVFPGYTTKQLDEMMRVYQEARQTLYPEMPGATLVEAEDIPVDLPAVKNSQLTPEQVQKTLDLFKDAVAAPNAQVQRAAALELRKHVFAQRAASAHESAEAMIAEGMNPEEAIKAAEQMFMSGKLPDLTTDYFDDLTQEMRNVLFAKVYNYWKDKSWTELISTFEALTNALAGKSIPRVKGIGTQYFPDGGSAWDRLARVFVGDVEVLEALDKQLPLPKIIEGVFLQTGRGEVQLNQDTVDWLKTLGTISEEDKLLLTKPFSELTETDVRLIAERWFYNHRKELQTLLRAGTISRQEYELELGIAKDRVFPYKPIAPAITFPTGPIGQARLGEIYVPPQPIEETRTPAELRLIKERMEAEMKLAEAKLRGAKQPFQPVMLDAALNDELSKQLPLLTLREKGTIIRTLKNIGMTIVDIGNLIRANKASFDFSFWRQAKLLAAGHPVKFYHANIEAWKALWSQASAEASWVRITRHPFYQFYLDAVRKGGTDFLRPLDLPKGTAQYKGVEEFGFLTGERPIPRFTAKIPWVKFSSRSFVTGTNDIAWNTFVDLIKGSQRYAEKIASGDVKLAEGEGFSLMDDVVGYTKMLGDFGQRASLGKAAPLAPELSALFFAPRSKLGRLLTPRHLISSNPRVRAEAWRDLSTFVGAMGGLVMLGYWLGLWDVEDDPRNAEFMSIRIGNLRIDPWAGYRQFLVLYARLITGTGISSVTGQEYEVNPIAALTTFFRGSLAPLSSELLNFWTGKNFLGDEVDIANPKQWVDRIAPFAIQTIYEAFQDSWQHGLIAIIPSIFGEGVSTYTGDWRENWNKLGLPKYPENTGYGIYEPLYDLADFWADTASQFRGVDPAEITEAKGFPPYVRSIVQALQIIDQIELLPNKKLTSINADPEQGTTFLQYYQMWQDRERIVASGDKDALKAFDADERTRNAYLGNLTQAQYALLVEYHSLPETEKADFLGRHPELYVNPREEWLRTHPEENALLALWGKADPYSTEAVSRVSALRQSLGIPENALVLKDLDAVSELKLKNQHLSDLVDAYGGLDDTFKGPDGLTARDRAIQQLYLDNPDFRDDERRIDALNVGTKDNPTLESMVEGWVERGQVADEFGPSSAEMKLWLIDNKEVHQWALENGLLSDTGEDWNENILRLQVNYSQDFNKYDDYGDITSTLYISDDGARADAREAMLFDSKGMTSFGVAYYTIKALKKNIPEGLVTTYVDYYGIRKKEGVDYAAGWYEDDWYLLENPGFYQTMVSMGLWQEKDFTKVPTRRVFSLYQTYSTLKTFDARLDFRSQHPDLDKWLVLAKRYTPVGSR